MTQGKLFIISAPSGAGKTSLVHKLITGRTDTKVSISHTTRAIRPGEVDGLNYHFVNEQIFQQEVKEGLFLEHALVFGHHYGTSKAWVMQQLDLGINIILEIDWQGAKQVRKAMPDAASIFILPPSLATLKTRLQRRGQDNEQIINARMQKAQAEISHYAEYDYLILNDEFELALQQLNIIMDAELLKLSIQKVVLQSVIHDLLQEV